MWMEDIYITQHLRWGTVYESASFLPLFNLDPVSWYGHVFYGSLKYQRFQCDEDRGFIRAGIEGLYQWRVGAGYVWYHKTKWAGHGSHGSCDTNSAAGFCETDSLLFACRGIGMVGEVTNCLTQPCHSEEVNIPAPKIKRARTERHCNTFPHRSGAISDSHQLHADPPRQTAIQNKGESILYIDYSYVPRCPPLASQPASQPSRASGRKNGKKHEPIL
jgi:hypothetical protein